MPVQERALCRLIFYYVGFMALGDVRNIGASDRRVQQMCKKPA
jgi:hypothetical protein